MNRTSLHPVEIDILSALYQHRVATADQLRRMVAPDASGQWVRKLLRRLGPEDRGLVDFVRHRGANASHVSALKVWFLTAPGVKVAESDPSAVEERHRRQLTAGQAAGRLQLHALAVNEVGLAFMEAARRRGEECGPWAWLHEWPVGKERDLIADAWLQYSGHREDRRFIEVDRLTMPTWRVVEKLERYQGASSTNAGLAPVLVVFGGAEGDVERRMARVMNDYRRSRGRPEGDRLPIALVDLEALRQRGPWADIFLRIDGVPDPVWGDWEKVAERTWSRAQAPSPSTVSNTGASFRNGRTPEPSLIGR